ncbi:MAG: hypothetical protein JNL83_35340 [Myxococcales bacterium]|nr:hypothetical protein [Myxococcales bacterium]
MIYCLAVAAQKYEIDVIDFIALSNHLHYAIFDRHRNAPEFCGYFHRLLAKCMNAFRGRVENFFSTASLSLVRLERRGDLIEKLTYIATNAVQHGLVATAAEWPGARGFDALITGEPLRATRPKFFFSETGTMPTEAALHLTLPPEVGDRVTFVTELLRRISTLEVQTAEVRMRLGMPVLGGDAVLRQSWMEIPASAMHLAGEPLIDRTKISPTIAAIDSSVRKAAIERKLVFEASYREARREMLDGNRVPFPPGTYWLARFAGVAVADHSARNE